MKSKLFILMIVPIVLSMLYACSNNSSYIRLHPDALKGVTNCTECHEGSLGAINHQALDFYKKHRFLASNARQTCASCHQESFCNDCHAGKDELKPSEKFADRPDRNLPHRGDYLSQHKIDGKMNPASCVKCHGRQNNAGCASCHK